MTLQEIIETLAAVAAGGAITQTVAAIVRLRKSDSAARVTAARADALEDANDRKSITFTIGTLERRIEALSREVHEARHEAKRMELQVRVLSALIEKHTDLTHEDIAAERMRISAIFGDTP